MKWMLVAVLGACTAAIAVLAVTKVLLRRRVDARRAARGPEGEAWLHAILDNACMLVSVKDASGRYVMVNRRFEDVLGVTAAIARGRGDEDLFALETAAALRAHDDDVVTGGRCVEIDQSVSTAGGRRRFYCVKAPIRDAAGTVMAVCTLATDITDRESAHRERNRLFELSPDMMAAASVDGRLRVVNPQWERVTGFSPADLVGREGFGLVHPEDRADVLRGVDELRRGQHLVEFVTRLRCKDGEYKRCGWRVVSAIEEGMVYVIGRELAADAVRGANDVRLTRRNDSRLH